MINFSYAQLPILKSFIVRPRLLLAIAVGIIIFFVMPQEWRFVTKLLLGWDTGVGFYLILAAFMMHSAGDDLIRKRAASQDEGSLVILLLTVLVAITSVVAIMRELVIAKSLSGDAAGQAIALAAITVVLSWFFMQTMFALHYAHAYYNPENNDKGGGLEFPARYSTPDYWDFVYFSFIIGTAAQTADINITSRAIRRVVTLQCIIVFFFNTTILALAINIGAGLAS